MLMLAALSGCGDDSNPNRRSPSQDAGEQDAAGADDSGAEDTGAEDSGEDVALEDVTPVDPGVVCANDDPACECTGALEHRDPNGDCICGFGSSLEDGTCVACDDCSSDLLSGFGVMSGDVTADGATLWVRSRRPTGVQLLLGTSRGTLAPVATAEAAASKDNIAQVRVDGLEANTEYTFVFEANGHHSPVGRFRTAPAAGQSQAQRFIFSGDVHQDRSETWGVFDIMDQAAPDFFINMGDWPYCDSASTVSAYESLHKRARSDARMHNFFADTPVYAIFDDHEVTNDWDGAYRQANPEDVEIGLSVFSYWWPQVSQLDGVFYRSYRRGDLEFFFLDTRSHRSANAMMDGPEKSMLGETQLQWLLSGLSASDAVFKFVITSVPLDFTTTGNDAWRGFRYERDLIFDHIADGDIGGVVFLTADQHWFSAHHHNAGYKEFQTGSLSAHLRTPVVYSPHQVEVLETYNYGVIDYDPEARTITMRGFDTGGNSIYEEVVKAGRGQIEVDANVPARFTLCPADVETECTHVFTGQSPRTIKYATPGTYTIQWEAIMGYQSPTERQTLTLGDGETIRFTGTYTRQPVPLPFSEDFADINLWTVVDEGLIEAPSNWTARTEPTPAFVQSSNIYDLYTSRETEDPLNPTHLPKLGTVLFGGDPEWGDYSVDLRATNTDDDGFGLVVRAENATTYYRIHFNIERQFARITKRQGDNFTVIASVTGQLPINQGEATDLRVECQGSAIRVYIGGADTPWIEAADGDIIAGGMGLYTWGSNGVIFDQLEVQAL